MKKKEARLKEIEGELHNVKNYGKEFSKNVSFKAVKKSEMRKLREKYPEVQVIKVEKTMVKVSEKGSSFIEFGREDEITGDQEI